MMKEDEKNGMYEVPSKEETQLRSAEEILNTKEGIYIFSEDLAKVIQAMEENTPLNSSLLPYPIRNYFQSM